MHFVALGVFAYDAGGTLGVGIAGLVRLLPAALLAPFASALGDRFRRERLLLATALVARAARSWADRVPRRPGVVFAAGALPLAAAAALFASVRVEGRLGLAAPERSGARKGLPAGFAAVLTEPKPRLVVALVAAQGFVRAA